MNQINQKAGKNSIQAGVVGRDLKVDNRKMGMGAWGCLALSIIAITSVVAVVLNAITRETGLTIREAAPAMVTMAVVQATTYAPVPIPVSQPVSNPVTNVGASTDIPPEISQFVSNFLGMAIELQIKAYSELNPAYVEDIMYGPPLQQIQSNIAQLQIKGQYYIPYFDYSQSRYVDIRIIDGTSTEATLEVDICEVSGGTYYAWDGSLLQEVPVDLYPQTITIYLTNAQAWITNVVFHSSASFCY